MNQTRRNFEFLTELGLRRHKSAGLEHCCDCPSCGKERHFHYNEAKCVGHCKVCGEGLSYLETAAQIVQNEWSSPNESDLEQLSKWREIPSAAFTGTDLKAQAGMFALICRSNTGKAVDIMRCKFGSKWKSAPGASVCLFGAQQLADNSRTDDPHYLCEGEWDALAMDYALKQSGKPGVVLAVPGANVFKPHWAEWLGGRRVIVLYDNDAPGAAGERRVAAALRHTADSVQFHVWDAALPEKYDISDLIGGK